MIKEKLKLVSNERAVLVGAVISIVSVIGEYTVDGDVNWRSAFPVIAGIVIRQFVYGPKAVEDAQAKLDDYNTILTEIIANVAKKDAENAAAIEEIRAAAAAAVQEAEAKGAA